MKHICGQATRTASRRYVAVFSIVVLFGVLSIICTALNSGISNGLRNTRYASKTKLNRQRRSGTLSNTTTNQKDTNLESNSNVINEYPNDSLSLEEFVAFKTKLEKYNRERRSILISNTTNRNDSAVTTQNMDPESNSNVNEYPEDVFSLEEKRKGAVVLHVFGLCYMFLALATVSDEYFIPSLEVIIEEFSVTEDVAGATFMAAGGSAPELFTAIIGTFIAKSNVGFGTIVGSAVFNLLFVIGMCAVVSEGSLRLTWWPLFRDCFFYSAALILLIGFFLNGRSGVTSKIYYWETSALILFYFVYVIFMKFNTQIEGFVKKQLGIHNPRVSDMTVPGQGARRDTDLYVKKALQFMKKNGKDGECFRFGLLQLVMRTMDPLRDGTVVDIAREMETMHNRIRSTSDASVVDNNEATVKMSSDNGLPNSPVTSSTGDLTEPTVTHRSSTAQLDQENCEVCIEEADISEIPAPLDVSWPDSVKDRIVYVIRGPIIFLLHFTLSDVRKTEKRGRWPWSFFMSILWIVIFSYFMVWWAKEISVTMGIDDEIMGLTVLAAGTSIPDLITSVLVARKGYGDMAVSSSVGSNLFDVTVGLPLPWLLWSILNAGRSFEVKSSGLFCSTILLFVMLLAVVTSIAVCKWRMSKALGCAMLALYITFNVLAVLLQKEIIECPF